MPPALPPLDSPVALAASHDVAAFDCGVGALNDYLQRHALSNQRSESARTYAAARANRVVGYYTLAAGSVEPSQVPERVRKGLARHPVPVILLARLTVDQSEQGRGLGKGLLKDALLRTSQAADIIGCRALLVHAKDAKAQAFYRQYDFESSPTDELHLYLLMKDLRKNLGI